MDYPRAGLRYVDADDLADSAIDFDGLDVESEAGEKLGDVDGFIIDTPTGRPIYVVVDAGGWFTSKYFLVPVGHVGLDSQGKRLVADVSRERVKNFPGFDRDEFEKLTEDELSRMDERIISACCPGETIDRTTSAERYYRWVHFRSPSWWDASYYSPTRADSAARSMASSGVTPSTTYAPASTDEVRASRDATRRPESVVARAGSEGDVSPHYDGRAQPGDVLGLETGGEQTHVGETSDDENKRRQDAEKDARKR